MSAAAGSVRLLADVENGRFVDGDVLLHLAIVADDAVRELHASADRDPIEKDAVAQHGLAADRRAVSDHGIGPDLAASVYFDASADEARGAKQRLGMDAAVLLGPDSRPQRPAGNIDAYLAVESVDLRL